MPEGSLGVRAPAASRRHWRRFAAGQALAWSGVAVLFSLAALARGQPPTRVAWLVAANVAVGLVVSTILAVVLQRLHWQALSLSRLIPLSLAGAVLAAAGHVMLATLSGQVPGGWSFTGFASPDPFGVVRPVILYLLWTAGLLAVELGFDRREARQRLAALEREALEAEFQLLQSQFDPHFLFNALTLVQAEADDPARVQELTLRLSQYLRAALRPGLGLVPAGEQAETCLAYLELQRARFGPRLSWQLAIDDAAAAALLPSLSVQTLVENAVRHSLEAEGGPAEIVIAARCEAEAYVLDVSHPGRLADRSPDDPPTASQRTGLASQGTGLPQLARRLELALGPQAGLDIRASAGRVQATIRIPRPETAGS